jgi:membrane protein
VGALVGGIALLLGASGVFSELESSLNFIWRVESKATGGLWSTLLKALKAKAFAFAVVVAAASAVLASLIVSTVLGAIAGTTSSAGAGHALWRLIDFATSLAFVTVLLAAIYRIVPSRRVQWGDVFGAAFVASLLLTTLKYLLAWYLANVGSYAAYGAVGAVLGLLTWIYCASLVLFYGAEVSVLHADRFGSVARAKRSSAARHEGGASAPPAPLSSRR